MQNTPTRTAREQFDRQATHYNAQWNQWSEETLCWLLEHSDARPTDTLLDVATGTGFTALAFAPHVASVVGLDVSTGMLAQARLRAEEQGIVNAMFVEGSAESIPYPDAAFDLVTCRIAPHHFLSVPQFLSETARVLKPGGRLLLGDTTVPDDNYEAAVWQNSVETLRDPSHVRNYTPSEWCGFVDDAGLTVTDHDASGGIGITLADWMIKGGCTPEQSDAVRAQFTGAPASVAAAYQIETLADGDIRFVWQRVVLKAVKQLDE